MDSLADLHAVNDEVADLLRKCVLYLVIFHRTGFSLFPQCRHEPLSTWNLQADLLSMEPPASIRVPSQIPLAPRVASVTSVANDKGDNEVILGLCTDILAFALQLRNTLEKRS